MNSKDIKNISNYHKINERVKLDSDAIKYHTIQWETPKRSTLAFEKFISHKLLNSKNIIDLGSGAGAVTAYLASRNNSINFTAFEYLIELVDIGIKVKSTKELDNLSFEQGDWYNLNLNQKYDGCISLQTLSWLPDYETPLIEIFQKINPNFIALTSLFYEGDITCHIQVDEHLKNKKYFYNVYALPAIRRLCEKYGYNLKTFIPFEIDIDIEKPDNLNIMGTYTQTVIAKDPSEKKLLQISGPLLMNWYMLLIEKNI